jgi:putative glutamine amidotransferase
MNREILVSASYPKKAQPYVEALKAVGVPSDRIRVLLPADRKTVGERIASAAGLVLSGGVDIEPSRYREQPLPGANLELKPERDELEWELLDEARVRRLPTWCICRGLQAANVFLGGTLWQDLPSQRPSPVPHEIDEPPDALAHLVEPARVSTPLAGRIAPRLLVNSRHHQAIKDLAPGFLPVATSADGLVEAAELDTSSGWWLRGVQWHPENLIAMEEQRVLWEDFARALDGAR